MRGRTPKPPYLKAIDAETKRAQLPRRREIGPPPEELTAAEAAIWVAEVRAAAPGTLGSESRGLLKLLCVNQVLWDCDNAELTLLRAKSRPTAKVHQRIAELRRNIRMSTTALADLRYKLALTPRGVKALGLVTAPPHEVVAPIEQMLRDLDQQSLAEWATMRDKPPGPLS